jgi:hypothetical protein
MSELSIQKPAARRRRWLDASKMIGIALVLGPPIAAFVSAFALIVPHTMLSPLEPLDNWRGFAMLPVAFAYSLFLGLLVALPATLFSHKLGSPTALFSAILFVILDRFVPAGWSRPWLGAFCGGLLTCIWFAHEFSEMSGFEFLSNVAILTLGGCVSGAVCALIFRRFGLTR